VTSDKPPQGQTELSFFPSGSPSAPRERPPAPPRAPARAPAERAPTENSETEPNPVEPRAAKPSRPGPEVYSVGDLVRGVNTLLEARFPQIWVEGEVVGLKVGSGGHAYFTLKDDVASLPTAMWRSSIERLKFRLADGQKLRVRGRLGVFVKQGRFQFYADRAEPAGLGALMIELEQRKQRLAAEGLFDASRKRPLPVWPRRIGVVTSAHGAAFHDILKVARRRCPMEILLAPALVQGSEAAGSIRRALARLVRSGRVDVIIVGRGGGSLEDLFAFNDEALARDIAACPIPVVSAVGHEVDVTICDLVADVRAATPSQAAELVVPDRKAELARIDGLSRRVARALERAVLDERARLEPLEARLRTAVTARISAARSRVRQAERGLEQTHPRSRTARARQTLQRLDRRLEHAMRPLMAARRQALERLDRRLPTLVRPLVPTRRMRLDRAEAAMRQAVLALLSGVRLRFARAAGALDALSPLAVLGRGYALVRSREGAAIRDARELHPGQVVELSLARGSARAEVTEITPLPEDSN